MITDKNVGGFLQDAFLNNRAAHAYIVVGERRQLLQLLQQCAIVCMCKNHTGCNCDNCKKVRENLHQDVLHFPADSQRDRLNVADMERLVDECYKRPIDADSNCRVFLVDASNSVTGPSAEVWQNKLLKTLEEPTDDVYIFVGVTDSEALLPTVRSRCQVLRQTKLTIPEVCAALQQHYEKNICEIAACVSGGSVENAEAMLANPSSVQAFDAAVDVLTNMSSSKNAVKYASAVASQRDNIKLVLQYMTVLLRESIVYRLAEELCLLPSHADAIVNICKNYSLQAAEVCIETINSAKKRLDDGGNATLVVDQLMSTLLEVKFRCRI